MALRKQTKDALVGQTWRDDTINQIASFNPAIEVGYLHPLRGIKRKNLLVIVRDGLTGKCLSVDLRYLDNPPPLGKDNWIFVQVQELKGRQPVLSDIQASHREIWGLVGTETLYCWRTIEITKWKTGDKDHNFNRLYISTPHGEMIKLIQFGLEPMNPGQKILSRINHYGIPCQGAKLWKPREQSG